MRLTWRVRRNDGVKAVLHPPMSPLQVNLLNAHRLRESADLPRQCGELLHRSAGTQAQEGQEKIPWAAPGWNHWDSAIRLTEAATQV